MNHSPDSPKLSWWSRLPALLRYGIVGVSSAGAALCVAYILLMVFGNRANAAPVAQTASGSAPAVAAAALPSATPAPSAMPQATAVPPTATPAPFATPKPTATPDPNQPQRPRVPFVPQASNAEYYDTIDSYMTELGDTLAEIGIDSYETGATPELLYDQSWQLGMLLNITQLQLVSSSIRDLQPPAEAQEFHAFLTDTTLVCDSATDHMTRGIDLMNEYDMQNAALEWEAAYYDMDECGYAIYEAAALYPVPSTIDF